MATRAMLAVALLALFGVACGGSPTPTAAPSTSAAPTADSATLAYVAMVKAYWNGILAADGVENGNNAASRACLGTVSDSASPDVTLVEPAKCHARVVLLLAVQQKFHSDDENTPPPAVFQQDDRVFETQVPIAIAALQALLSASATGSKQATFDASNTYVAIMLATVVPALDRVDPSTHHY